MNSTKNRIYGTTQKKSEKNMLMLSQDSKTDLKLSTKAKEKFEKTSETMEALFFTIYKRSQQAYCWNRWL
jgi:hypothetical protein